MNDEKFVTVVHNALEDAAKIDIEMKKLGFTVSFKHNGKEITFPTTPIRLYFMEVNGDVKALRDKYISTMENMWEKLKIKKGVASVLVGDDWRV